MPMNIITVNGREYYLNDSRMPLLMRIMSQYGHCGSELSKPEKEEYCGCKEPKVIMHETFEKGNYKKTVELIHKCNNCDRSIRPKEEIEKIPSSYNGPLDMKVNELIDAVNLIRKDTDKILRGE